MRVCVCSAPPLTLVLRPVLISLQQTLEARRQKASLEIERARVIAEKLDEKSQEVLKTQQGQKVSRANEKALEESQLLAAEIQQDQMTAEERRRQSLDVKRGKAVADLEKVKQVTAKVEEMSAQALQDLQTEQAAAEQRRLQSLEAKKQKAASQGDKVKLASEKSKEATAQLAAAVESDQKAAEQRRLQSLEQKKMPAVKQLEKVLVLLHWVCISR